MKQVGADRSPGALIKMCRMDANLGRGMSRQADDSTLALHNELQQLHLSPGRDSSTGTYI